MGCRRACYGENYGGVTSLPCQQAAEYGLRRATDGRATDGRAKRAGVGTKDIGEKENARYGGKGVCVSCVFGRPRLVQDQDRWLEYKVSGEREASTGRMGRCSWRETEGNGDSSAGRDW